MGLAQAQLRADGKLKKLFRPAVYLDTSVVIDYWLVEGWEFSSASDDLVREQQHITVLRELLRADKRLNRVARVREKLVMEGSGTTAIVSPLCLLELMEWNAEQAFKNLAAGAASVQLIQKQGKKQTGEYLKQLLKLRRDEAERREAIRRELGCSTALDIIMAETWLGQSFVYAHGLDGLFYADIKAFSFPFADAWQEPSAFAYLQLGGADIMHLMLAKHLGCEYVASFDSDFARVSEIVKEEMGITILNSPEELLAIV